MASVLLGWDFAYGAVAALAAIEVVIVALYLGDTDGSPCDDWLGFLYIVPFVVSLFLIGIAFNLYAKWKDDKSPGAAVLSSLTSFVVGTLALIGTILVVMAVDESCDPDPMSTTSPTWSPALILIGLATLLATVMYYTSTWLPTTRLCAVCFDDVDGPACFEKSKTPGFRLYSASVALLGVGTGITLFLAISPLVNETPITLSRLVPLFISLGLYFLAAIVYLVESANEKGDRGSSLVYLFASILVAVGLFVSLVLLPSVATNPWAYLAPLYGTLFVASLLGCCLHCSVLRLRRTAGGSVAAPVAATDVKYV